MRHFLIAIIVALALGAAGSAEERLPPFPPLAVQAASDNAGPATELIDKQVSLRDFLLDRITQSEKQLREQLRDLMDERDRQYAQRFDAQQQAVAAALQAAKEAVANALSAAKEAVTKAEEASNKRFDSVNEFRNTLTDQAKLFLPAGEADVRFRAIEEKVAAVTAQLANAKSSREGANDLWLIIVAGIGAVAGIGGLLAMFQARRDAPAAKRTTG